MSKIDPEQLRLCRYIDRWRNAGKEYVLGTLTHGPKEMPAFPNELARDCFAGGMAQELNDMRTLMVEEGRCR